MLGLWTILGFVLISTFPKPETKKQAVWQLFLGGPLCWIVFPLVAVCRKYIPRPDELP